MVICRKMLKGSGIMLYVAYGSNTNIEQMKERCPLSKIKGNGILKNWKLVFNYHLDIIREKGKSVPVVLWDINDEDWALLDRYEGYPKYYVKEKVKVKMENGKNVDAVVYVMAEDRKGIYPPSISYLATCEDGYIENGLDTSYLYDALVYSYGNETENNQYNPKRKTKKTKSKGKSKYKRIKGVDIYAELPFI